MTFATLSWPWLLGGLVALAAGLFALQILRVRYREVTVVSTLLWRHAVQDSAARKLRERFKHPLAYLLVLAICSLIWLALAEPRPQKSADGNFHVLVLDGSAGMAAGSRFEQATAALEERLEALPADRRQVLWSGAEVRTLLNPGEDLLLLERRLRDLRPEAAPSGLVRLLGELAMTRHGTRDTEVTIFGDAPLQQAAIDSFPEGFSVKRAQAVERMAHNAGITALGVADAESGQWDKVDVYLYAQANDDAAIDAGDLEITVDGEPPGSALQAQRAGEGWLIRDVSAQGGLLTVELAGADALPADNIASIRLPNKPFINVQLSPALDASLVAVLRADPAVRLVDSGAQLVIRNAGEDLGVDLPALEFVAATEQQQAFHLTYPGTTDNEARFREAVNATGLRQIDAMALADAARRPIEVAMQPGAQYKLSLWRELLSEDFNFTRSRAFPLFVANAVRWLAGIPAAYPYAAAGRPLVSDSIDGDVHVIDAQGRAIDPLGVPFVPEQAGELTLGSARPLAVSLLDPATTTGAGESAILPLTAGISGGAGSASIWVTVLILLALMLLAGEWYWYRKGRMP